MRIAFASGKGGTGKTTFATNMAVSIAAENENVTYADCDVEEPNGHIFLPPENKSEINVEVLVPSFDKEKCKLSGVCSDVCEYNAIAVLEPLPIVFPSLCHSCGACYELCPEDAITEIPRKIGVIEKGSFRKIGLYSGRLNVGEAIAPPVICALKKELPDDGIVIIDAPPGTSCPVIEAVKNSDYVVLVTEPTPFGLNDLELAYKMLEKLKLPFGVIINRSDVGNNRVDDFCRDKNIEILLRVPFSKDIAMAYSNGKLIIDTDNEFSNQMKSLFKDINKRINNG